MAKCDYKTGTEGVYLLIMLKSMGYAAKFATLWPDTGFKKCNGKWVEKVGGMWVLLLKY